MKLIAVVHESRRYTYREFEQRVNQLASSLFEARTQEDPYEVFLSKGSSDPLPDLVANEEEPISMNYTSGTTGRTKGVVYCHRGAYLNALKELIESGVNADSVYLWTLPMFHCSWCFT